ncbi:hypothetical protein [Flavobacterium sp. HBTb2-11-1]|uniref:hypothetical protein n=1 Tax=Flavobacterium sp. HBTb2-11-1 TaxID=2692212 RepID=UPI00136A478A|nr:hypothetical protein [Flavobacterium sp. HBTb2-11-1]MXO06548.1 hypothetical protein [Flavobacterium sp. HBTb2-11-1]
MKKRKVKKICLANIGNKLTTSEMESIMAGSGYGCGTVGIMFVWANVGANSTSQFWNTMAKACWNS